MPEKTIIAANISQAIYCFEMHKDQNSPFNAISFFLAKHKLLSASEYAHCSEIISEAWLFDCNHPVQNSISLKKNRASDNEGKFHSFLMRRI